uniref:Uncharacterized protein n=1 Tax=Solanum lycopersicum TaxID=4081 RepID=A0A3Q7GVP9_SOLLC
MKVQPSKGWKMVEVVLQRMMFLEFLQTMK